MRWWPFGRRDKKESSDVGSSAAAPSPASSPAPETVASPQDDAWRRLPPLRPTSASLKLTAPVQRLESSMSTPKRMQLAAAELVHDRTPVAPAGSVAGIVRSRQITGSAGPLPLVDAPEPVVATEAVALRRVGSAPQRLPDTVPEPTRSPDRPVSRHRELAAQPAARSDTARSVPAPEQLSAGTSPELPARRMPTRVPRPVPVAAVTPPAPVVAPQRQPASRPAAPPARPVGGDEGPIVSSPDHPDRRPVPPVASSRVVRRIGAPMSERPRKMVERPTAEPVPSVPLQHTSAPQRLPLAPGELPARSPRAVVAAAASNATSDDRRPETAPHPRHSVKLSGRARPIQRLSGVTPALTAAPPPGGSGPTPIPVRRGVQRSPETVPPDLRAELEPRLGESLDDVRVHRGPEVGDAARSIRAKAFAVGGEVYLPDEHGPTTAGEGRRILAHELTHVAQQRRFGSSLPAEHTPEGQRLEREALEVGGQAPVPVRRTSVAGPGAPQRLAGSSDTVAPREVRPVPAVGSQPDFAAQAAIAATIQRAAVGAGIPASVSTTPSTTPSTRPSRTPSTTPSTTMRGSTLAARQDANADQRGVAGPIATSPTPPVQRMVSLDSVEVDPVRPVSGSSEGGEAIDLEELERQLYPRLRSRLRHDLLTDRERSGRLFDRS